MTMGNPYASYDPQMSGLANPQQAYQGAPLAPGVSLAEVGGAPPMASQPPPMASQMPMPQMPTDGGVSVDPNANFMTHSGQSVSMAGPAPAPATPKLVEPRPMAPAVRQAAAPAPINGPQDYRNATTGQLQNVVGQEIAQKVNERGKLGQAQDRYDEEIRSARQTAHIQGLATAAETKRLDMEQAKVAKEGFEYGMKEANDIEARERANAARKVDPNRSLPKGFGGELLGMLGAAIGGAGQALTGKNTFMDTVNTMIERDIAAQQAEIDNERSGIIGAKNSLATRMNLYGNKEQAIVAQKINYIQNVDRYLADVQGQVESEGARMVIAEKRNALAESLSDLKINHANNIVHGRQMQAAADAAARRQAEKDALEQWNKNEDRDVKRMEAGQKTEGTFVKPLGGYVASSSVADKIYPMVDAMDTAENMVDRILSLAAKGSRMSPEDRGALSQASSQLVVAEKNRNGLGQLTGGDWGLVPVSPDTINDWLRGGQIGRLRELKTFIKSQRDQYHQNYVIRDARGNPVGRSARPGKIPNSLEKVSE